MASHKEKTPTQLKSTPKTKAPRIAKANPSAPPSITRRSFSKRDSPSSPPSKDALSSPEDKDEEEISSIIVSLAQFQRLEASIDERFEHLDVAFQSSYHNLNAKIDDKFDQLLQHLNPQLPGYSRLSQLGDNPSSDSGISGTIPHLSDDDVLS